MDFESNREEVIRQLMAAQFRGLQAVAIEVAGEAKKRTPVDTGRLRASIAWAAGPTPRTHDDSAQGQDGTLVRSSYVVGAARGEAHVGSNVEYAPYVHEDLDAYHAVGQAKFIETAFDVKTDRAQELMEMAMRGEL